MKLKAWNIFQIQGTQFSLGGDPLLTESASGYFRLLYQGGSSGNKETVRFELLAEEPPCLPSGAVKAMQGPYARCYVWKGLILFLSSNGTSMILLDPVRGVAQCFLDGELYEDTAEFFSLLGFAVTEALKYQGLYFLHSACVCGNGRSYLFSGSSGAGKTTAAFHLVRQGFRFVADDSIFLFRQDGEIVVFPYYTNFHVDENVTKRCPEVVGALKLRDPERGYARMRVAMSELYPDSFVSSAKPDRVIFPRIVSKGASGFSSVNQMTVYERLLKQTILAADTGVARDQLNVLEKLARQVKGFELFTGPDMFENPAILPDLLQQMEA